MATSGASALLPSEIEPIGGLLNANDYFAINVVEDAGAGTSTFQLATLEEPTVAIDLDTGAAGDSHLIVFDRAAQSFSPSAAVNDEANTIDLPAHGFSTGDAVLYSTDASISEEQDFRRTAFFGSTKPFTFDPSAESIFGNPVVDLDSNTIEIDDGLLVYTGQPIEYSSDGNAIGGLTSGSTYYAVRFDSGTLGFAASLSDADAGILIDLTAGASGTNHQLQPSAVNMASGEIVLPLHGLRTGQEIIYEAGGAASLGLADGGTYFAIVTSPDRIRVAATRSDASSGNAIPLSGTFQDNDLESFSTFQVVNRLDLSQSATIDETNNSIRIPNHGLVNGTTVVYRDDGQSIDGLVDGDSYLVQVVDADRIQLTLPGSTTPVSITTPEQSGIHLLDVIAADVDTQANLIFLGDHELSSGDILRYSSGGDSAIGGLIDGEDYEVERLNGDEIQLRTVGGEIIDLAAGASIDQLHSLTVRELSVERSELLPVDDLDLDANTILARGHGFSSGDEVRYQSKGDTAIGGLVSGETYEVVVVDGDNLRLQQAAAVIDLLPGASAGSVHALELLEFSDGESFDFIAEMVTSPLFSVEFNPSQQPVVDLAANTLRVPGHGFDDGEEIVYLTGGGTAIGGLVDGSSYSAVIVDSDTIQLADLGSNTPIDFISAGSGSNHGLERRSTVTAADKPIRGLRNGTLYYVTAVDADTIRLSETRQGAVATAPIDLDATIATGDTHTLKTDVGAGVKIDAELSAENSVTVGAGIGSSPGFSDLVGIDTLLDYESRTLQKSILQNDTVDKLRGASEETNDAFSGTGSTSFAIIDHTVDAFIGPGATVKSGQDVEVGASIEQEFKTSADARVISDDGGKTNRSQDKTFAASVGLAVGDLTNEARAIIDAGAIVDAGNDVSVASKVEYPLLVTPLSLVPLVDLENGGKPNLDDEFLDGISDTLGGTLGLTDIVNVWVSTSNGGKGTTDGNAAAKYTVAGSIAAMTYDNTSEAIIREGAQVNQDAAFDAEGQSVFVEAETSMELVSVAGGFFLNVGVDGIRNSAAAAKGQGTAGAFKKGPREAFTLLGNKSGEIGIGGSALVQQFDNQTLAIIEEGAQVDSGPQGIVEVNSEEDVFTFEFVQAGGESGKSGVSGSFSILDQDSDTIAHIEGGTDIDAGAVGVSADGGVSHIALTGAVQFSKSFGAGVSVGIQNLNRNTLAIIGDETIRFDADRVDASTGHVAISGHGLQDGDLVSYRPADDGVPLARVESRRKLFRQRDRRQHDLAFQHGGRRAVIRFAGG